MGPRIVNLSVQMDPILLSESAVKLNLQLMKWRIKPELNLENIQNKSVLLIGAGTLGTYLSRSLMVFFINIKFMEAWGIKIITFVDGSKVSYSNPVRQPLYSHADAKNGLSKVEAAISSLRSIYPSIVSQTISSLTFRMHQVIF